MIPWIFAWSVAMAFFVCAGVECGRHEWAGMIACLIIAVFWRWLAREIAAGASSRRCSTRSLAGPSATSSARPASPSSRPRSPCSVPVGDDNFSLILACDLRRDDVPS